MPPGENRPGTSSSSSSPGNQRTETHRASVLAAMPNSHARNNPSRFRGDNPRMAVDVGFRILPFPQHCVLAPELQTPTDIDHQNAVPGCISNDQMEHIVAAPLCVPVLSIGPTTSHTVAVGEALLASHLEPALCMPAVLGSTRESHQRQRVRGFTPRKVQSMEFQILPLDRILTRPESSTHRAPEWSQPCTRINNSPSQPGGLCSSPTVTHTTTTAHSVFVHPSDSIASPVGDSTIEPPPPHGRFPSPARSGKIANPYGGGVPHTTPLVSPDVSTTKVPTSQITADQRHDHRLSRQYGAPRKVATARFSILPFTDPSRVLARAAEGKNNQRGGSNAGSTGAAQG